MQADRNLVEVLRNAIRPKEPCCECERRPSRVAEGLLFRRIFEQKADEETGDGKGPNALQGKGDSEMVGDDAQERHPDASGPDGKANEETRGDAEVPRQEILPHHDGHREGGDEDHAQQGHRDQEHEALKVEDKWEQNGAPQHGYSQPETGGPTGRQGESRPASRRRHPEAAC